MPDIRYFSHSRCDVDEKCRRARYHLSEWGGTGLTPVLAGWDLTYGNIIHQHLNTLAKEDKINYADARKQVYEAGLENSFPVFLARDWGALAEGHLRGFVKAIWTRWIAEYERVESEKLRSWDVAWNGGLEGLTQVYRFRYRQDLLFRNKITGEIVYIDYKTTSDDSPKWIASWAKSPQLHTSAYAMKQSGLQIDQLLVQGFYKGWKDKKTGAPGSIFCKGWVNREYSMSPQYSYEYKRTKGWEAFSVAEEFDDLTEWVNNMPQQILTAQFPQTAPIFPRDDIGQTWFRQQLIREREVAGAVHKLQFVTDEAEMTEIMDTHFKQNFSKCQPSFGYECEFKDICWVPSVGADPLASGLFKPRQQVFEDGEE